MWFELLVAKGADINALDKELRTPLAYSRDKKRFVRDGLVTANTVQNDSDKR